MKKGFTLIELLVSLTILSLFLSSFFYVFSSQIRATKRLTLTATHSQTISLLLQRISCDVRAASQILPDSNSSRLCLQVENDVIEYYFYGGELKRRKNNSSPSPLTQPGEVENIFFLYGEKLVETKIDGQILAVALRN